MTSPKDDRKLIPTINPCYRANAANFANGSAMFALLKAQAALIGQTLIKVPSGYQISRWGMFHHCATVGEVQATLKRMGARL